MPALFDKADLTQLTQPNLNVVKTFKQCPGRHISGLFTFSLHGVSTSYVHVIVWNCFIKFLAP